MTQTNNPMSPFEMAALAANLAESKKAKDVQILETEKVSCLSDYFVVCSGESAAQIRTIADEIAKAFKARGLMPLGQEQDKLSRWCLLDYGDIVVHVMNPQERQFYQLEHFWSHANPVDPGRWLQQAS